jgi:hypothetical protein
MRSLVVGSAALMIFSTETGCSSITATRSTQEGTMPKETTRHKRGLATLR